MPWYGEIESWLRHYLEAVERRYGEGRSPFRWPPRFRRRAFLPLLGRAFACVLLPDEPGRPRPILCRGRNPQELLDRVVRAVEGRFGAMPLPRE